MASQSHTVPEKRTVLDVFPHILCLSFGPALNDELTAQLVQEVLPHGITSAEVREQICLDSEFQVFSLHAAKGWPHRAKVPPRLLPYYHVCKGTNVFEWVLTFEMATWSCQSHST